MRLDHCGQARRSPAAGGAVHRRAGQRRTRRLPDELRLVPRGESSGAEGPELAGSNFLAQWGDKTAGALINFMQSTMPPGGAALPGDTYMNIAAFILDANSARPGDRALAAESNVVIRSVAPGQRAGFLQAGAAVSALPARSEGKQDKKGPPARQAPRGITVAGEVKNYVPVTDAMLRNPDPNDWLMLRHDYHATYYSPLNQITAQNVNNLRLVWSWAMQEGASNGNQPAPWFITA